ncbi:23S rRNA (guanosine(2251)-2'-O)-methyltransferase RlmB [Nitrosomonas sp.]|uniref:23S rRNA (guanosine(2251)-2'-O)-methyltransferase RlmB n=1 Tax=Nitrosomonas sp. TaxID=42353 RepID=UPI001D5A319C|nr:23S rRNA (guanosine(2251)-2'-O)-methyltransferase RlmB [Nitrosomonas sp.]MCB1949239.1 23S rRNA (guanosine(2251)-2'-O)-methyltransferase RlmB [Nitrosomonas sp.]
MAASRLIFGFHAVVSRLRQHPDSIREIYVDAGRNDQRTRSLIALAESLQVRLILCEHERLEKMTGGKRHQSVAATIDQVTLASSIDDVLDALTGPARLLILDGIQDPHNLGACLRVADAFGVHAVIAPKDRAVGLTAAVYQVSSGAAETVPYIAVTNLARTMRQIKERDIWIVGTADNADHDLNSFQIHESIAWVFGSEEKGMRRLTRETCDQLVRIPMQGSVESLNVSVSAGICLFETFRQHSGKTAGAI